MGGATAAVVHAIALRVNITASMPLGVYREVAPRLERGARVVFCLPEPAARLGLERGYLPHGACLDGSQELMKEIAAIPGDDVVLAAGGLSVNGQTLPGSALHAVDHSGRPLEHAPFGVQRVGPNDLWVVGTLREVSWDSRYFGPVPIARVRVSAVELITFEPRAEVAEPPLSRRLDGHDEHSDDGERSKP